jgi:hypothetical protein
LMYWCWQTKMTGCPGGGGRGHTQGGVGVEMTHGQTKVLGVHGQNGCAVMTGPLHLHTCYKICTVIDQDR